MTERRMVYDPVAKSLHWLVFLLLTAQFVVAVTMPPIRRGVTPETLISLHMSGGVLILLVVSFRLLWRLGHPVALAAEEGPSWLVSAARATHGLSYVLLLVLPLLGWAAASARDWRVTLFGFAPLPPLLPAKARIGFLAGDAHSVLSWALLALVALHVIAALYHHLVARDRVLRRMLPGDGA